MKFGASFLAAAPDQVQQKQTWISAVCSFPGNVGDREGGDAPSHAPWAAAPLSPQEPACSVNEEHTTERALTGSAVLAATLGGQSPKDRGLELEVGDCAMVGSYPH